MFCREKKGTVCAWHRYSFLVIIMNISLCCCELWQFVRRGLTLVHWKAFQSDFNGPHVVYKIAGHLKYRTI